MGIHKKFLIGNPPKRPTNSNFLNIHQIKNENMNADKNEWLRQSRQKLWSKIKSYWYLDEASRLEKFTGLWEK